MFQTSLFFRSMGKKGGFQKQIFGQYEIQCEKQMANHTVFSFISNSRALSLSVFLFLSRCQCTLAVFLSTTDFPVTTLFSHTFPGPLVRLDVCWAQLADNTSPPSKSVLWQLSCKLITRQERRSATASSCQQT